MRNGRGGHTGRREWHVARNVVPNTHKASGDIAGDREIHKRYGSSCVPNNEQLKPSGDIAGDHEILTNLMEVAVSTTTNS